MALNQRPSTLDINGYAGLCVSDVHAHNTSACLLAITGVVSWPEASLQSHGDGLRISTKRWISESMIQSVCIVKEIGAVCLKRASVLAKLYSGTECLLRPLSGSPSPLSCERNGPKLPWRLRLMARKPLPACPAVLISKQRCYGNRPSPLRR